MPKRARYPLESHNLRLSSYDIENMPGDMYARTHYPSIGKPCSDFKNNTWLRTAGEKNTGRMSRIEPMLDPRDRKLIVMSAVRQDAMTA
jgi:hypothetical protein